MRVVIRIVSMAMTNAAAPASRNAQSGAACRPAHRPRACADRGAESDTSTACWTIGYSALNMPGQHRHHHQEAHVALRFLERSRERGDVRLDRRWTAGTAAAPRASMPIICAARAESGCRDPAAACTRSIASTSAVVSTRSACRDGRGEPLPRRDRRRGAGLTSSGSSEPRSRSPAVESVAICIPPVKAAITMNSGMKLRIVGRALLRARDLDVLDLARRGDDRADAARDQPQAADLAAVALQQPRTRCIFGRGSGASCRRPGAPAPASTR